MMLIAQLSAARSNELLFIVDHDFFSLYGEEGS
jgi:hypothetical protein